MASKPLVFYWDSCCYISCIEQTPGRTAVLSKVIELAENGDVVLVASTLILAEVIKLNSADDSASQSTKIRDFFENDYIKLRPVDRKTAEDDRTPEHGIKRLWNQP